jgi:alpha-tubulin suppressor-like RCC1 family protein
MVCGKTFCYFHGFNGIWYGTGSNSFGQMGLGYSGLGINNPTPLTNINNLGIDVISTGGDSSIGINTNNGIAYGWGRNNYRNLGFGDSIQKNVPSMVFTLSGHRIKQVSMTESSTLFLTSTGLLYGVGQNLNGELGTGSPVSVSFPLLLQTNIIKVSSKINF